MRTLQISYRYTRLTGIVLICVLGLLPLGCGRKLFPQPEGEKPAPQVRDLQAHVTARGVELSWSIPPGGGEGRIRYAVTKSELDWANRNCLECPGATQQEVYSIDAASAPRAVSSDQKLHWFDPNVAAYRAYRYRIAVLDDRNVALAASNPAIARVYPGPVPPENVAAATQTQGILLQWKPVAKDSQGRGLQGDLTFLVERRVSEKDWENVSKVPVKGNSYLDQAVASELNYSYRVVPVLQIENTTVSGEPSAVVLAKAPEAVPPPPPNTVWVIPAKGALEVRWTESEGNVAGYYVYRREGKEIIRLTANPVQHPPFVDRAVKRNATYFYAVSAVSLRQDHKEGLLSKWTEIRNLLTE